MYGAICGDLAGSLDEYDQFIKLSLILKRKEIIEDKSFFSDDTILTIAVLDAILNNKSYNETLHNYIIKYSNYHPKITTYFKTSFSPGLVKWSKSNIQGTSCGNGAMMRISPIGYLFDTEEDVCLQAKLATEPSHNTKEAIDCATIIALIILWGRQHIPKNEIMKRVSLKFQIKYSPFQKFNTTCEETINNCLYALFSCSSFEESIHTILSYGGDTDTNACIVGSMAESIYGIPISLIEKVKEKLPEEFNLLLDKGYARIKKL